MSRAEAKMRPPQGGLPESPYSNMARELVELYVRQICLTDHLCLKEAMNRLERDIILHVLSQTNGNQHDAASILGVRANTLHYKMRRYGIAAIHRFDLEQAGRPH